MKRESRTAVLEVDDVELRRRRLLDLLGPLPSRDGTPNARVVATEDRWSYVLERLELDLNGSETVPAYFAKPAANGMGEAFPVVLYNHAHGDDLHLGKDELLQGRAALQRPPYVIELVSAGYAVFCADMWGFGDRRAGSETSLYKEMLWRGQILWGMRVFDTLRAVDYLTTRPDVDEARIATLGLSMGSTMAWWVAALDTRIKVCVDLCCLTDFQALIDAGSLDCHGVYYYVPGLLNEFDTADINALIAPRAHLSLAGRQDPLTPPAGLERIDASLRRVYADAGAADAWRLSEHETGHRETAAMRAEVMAFLAERL
jgi:dienelactone hydrolase